MYMDRNPGSVISRANFGEIFAAAWNKACKPENAISGFRKCGLCPLSFDAIPKDAFVISKELLGSSADMMSTVNVSSEFESQNDTSVLESDVPVLPVNPAEEVASNIELYDTNPAPADEIVVDDDGSSYLVLESNTSIQPRTSTGEIPFTELLQLPIHSSRKAAQDAFKRMREPALVTSYRFNVNDNEIPSRVQMDENTCPQCLISYYNDPSGDDWLQCMECQRWEHAKCGGKSTIGTFFCTACARKVIDLMTK